MNLKNLLSATSWLILVGLAGCSFSPGWTTVSGNGQITNSSRAVSNFDRVSVSGGGEFFITQGDEEGLTIETDENLLPLIKSEVSGGELWIGPKDQNLRPSRSLRYELKLKNLTALRLSGSAQAEAKTIKTEGLSLAVSGSGHIEIPHLEAKELSVHISGSGTTVVAGEVERQEVHISGSGSHRAAELKCRQASAHISGSGRATLRVRDELSAHISGSGDVEYYGSPQVSRQVSGSGEVRRVGD
ncbi:conserved exported hypothetical protein [Verrucomicrobia bacterium]|nr:conserved exported hypothetical protein [Verrucomicrobiota bacterium]